MTVLLAGAGGMLGQAMVAALATAMPGERVVAAGRDRLAVAEPARVLALVADAAPALVVNAAAHTDVEGAEADPDTAFAVNAELPGLLALACARAGIPLIHVSSTGCYGAWKDTPYSDYDRVEPTTVHHRSKIAGEDAVRASGCEHLIVRTSWLFGGDALQPKNFVFKRILEASKTRLMRSDPTQRGNPTAVGPLADAMLAAYAASVRGTCNIVAAGSASRLDYVREIVRLSGMPCAVEPSDGAFVRRAKVSPNEAAEMTRLRILGRAIMPGWQEQLASYVESLRASPAWPAANA